MIAMINAKSASTKVIMSYGVVQVTFAKPREPPAGKITFTVADVDWILLPVSVNEIDWSAPVSLKMESFPAVLGGMKVPDITTGTAEPVSTFVSGKVNGFALNVTPFM